MTSKSFVDSNIWLYALLEEKVELSKKEKVKTFLERLKTESHIIVSVQVLNEFHWVLKRKYQIEEARIRQRVLNDILELSDVVSLDLQTYKDAWRILDKYDIAYWDSIIVASALNSHCEILYSEDMQHDLEIENKLVIKNPLLLQ